VAQDPVDHGALRDERDDPHLRAARGTPERIDLEDLLHHLITMAAGGLFIGAAIGIMTAHRFASRYGTNQSAAAM